ncbi:MAG: phage tail assembly chaperone [Clostridia bacterium]|nr:phage tail assembly chaperone [Clostridia bacterium]
MRVQTDIRPSEFSIEVIGDVARLHFCENIRENDNGAEFRYSYDEYSLEVREREGLEESVKNSIEAWSALARRLEEETLARRIREKRQRLLEASDWTQSTDSPLDELRRKAWADYRTALRNIPEQEDFPYEVIFPQKPE